MSALPHQVVLDNTVLSALYTARAVSRLLTCGFCGWIVPLQVRDEAAAWRTQGDELVAILDRLGESGVLEYATPEPGPEAALFAELQRTRARGESAAIAIAHHRRLAVATDDRRARRSCEILNPPVQVFEAEDLLLMAVVSGLLPRREAQSIWDATGISDPKRRF